MNEYEINKDPSVDLTDNHVASKGRRISSIKQILIISFFDEQLE